MFLRIELRPPLSLIGLKAKMNYVNNGTFKLWHSFMPRLKEIRNRTSSALVSMQIYPDNYSFSPFDASQFFTKLAAVEVTDNSNTPIGLESYLFKGGLYAVFLHRGPANTAPVTFNYIFNHWLPGSNYDLDMREHFELLEPGYDKDRAEAQEEIYIPIIAAG